MQARCCEALKRIDAFWVHQGAQDFIDVLALRMKYGISRELIELVKLPGIGKQRALKLANIEILNKNDLIEKQDKAKSLLGNNLIDKILKEE